MKRNYLYALFLLPALFLLSGCEAEIDKIELSDPSVFTATIDGGEPATKTLLGALSGDKRSVHWSADDSLRIGGARYDVSQVSATDPQTATFTGNGAQLDGGVYKAYYPASIYNGGTPTLPATQTYSTMRIDNLPMYAQSAATNLEFKNLCAVLNFKLTGTDKVTKVVVTSATQNLSGPFDVVEATSGGGDWYAKIKDSDPAASNQVTLDCGAAGVQLDAANETEFCIAVPAADYPQNDLTVQVYGYKGSGSTEELLMPSFTNSVSDSRLERSKIYDITVAPAPPQAGSLTLSDPVVMYLNGDNPTQTLTVTAKDNNGSTVSNPTITWTSSAPGVATVSPTTGLITAVAAGTTTITASWEYGGQTETDTKTVTVKDLTFSISPTSMTLQTGATQALTLTAKDGSADASGVAYSYVTSNGNVAEVSGANITAGSTAGTATVTVTATWHGITKSATCEVTVASLSVTPSSAVTIQIGETLTAAATLTVGGAAVIADSYAWTYSSVGDENIANLNPDEVGNPTVTVTGLTAGKVKLTCTATYQGQTYTATTAEITVSGLEEDVITHVYTAIGGGFFHTGTNSYFTYSIDFPYSFTGPVTGTTYSMKVINVTRVQESGTASLTIGGVENNAAQQKYIVKITTIGYRAETAKGTIYLTLEVDGVNYIVPVPYNLFVTPDWW